MSAMTESNAKKFGPYPWERGVIRFAANTRTGIPRVFVDYFEAEKVAKRHGTRPYLIAADGRLYEVRPLIVKTFRERFGTPPWTCDSAPTEGEATP
jgi:hypothetical protein